MAPCSRCAQAGRLCTIVPGTLDKCTHCRQTGRFCNVGPVTGDTVFAVASALAGAEVEIAGLRLWARFNPTSPLIRRRFIPTDARHERLRAERTEILRRGLGNLGDSGIPDQRLVSPNGLGLAHVALADFNPADDGQALILLLGVLWALTDPQADDPDSDDPNAL